MSPSSVVDFDLDGRKFFALIYEIGWQIACELEDDRGNKQDVGRFMDVVAAVAAAKEVAKLPIPEKEEPDPLENWRGKAAFFAATYVQEERKFAVVAAMRPFRFDDVGLRFSSLIEAKKAAGCLI